MTMTNQLRVLSLLYPAVRFVAGKDEDVRRNCINDIYEATYETRFDDS